MSQKSCNDEAHWARVKAHEARIKAIWDAAGGDYAKAEAALMAEFGWTPQQCYQATHSLAKRAVKISPHAGN